MFKISSSVAQKTFECCPSSSTMSATILATTVYRMPRSHTNNDHQLLCSTTAVLRTAV